MADSALQTVDRALAILELLADHPEGLRLVDIAAAMSLNKVTVHRLLATLLARDFVEKREDSGRYLPGLRLVEISSRRLNSLELKTEAQPWLRRLVGLAGQPVHLAILDQNEIVYIEKIETVHSLRMYSQIGKRSPVYCTALGKVLLGAFTDPEAAAILQRAGIHAYTPMTLTDPQLILDEVREARRCGYALDRQEHEPGVFCAAAPVHDYRGQIIAAVSTAGSRQDFLNDPASPLIGWLLETAAAVSRRMGYVEPEK
ncbi:MAG TPA: IclR family transcriptional regulator [Clostridiales bacterium]|nr:IclR family transcriptional regulator [Clostridiales bacterium]